MDDNRVQFVRPEVETYVATEFFSVVNRMGVKPELFEPVEALAAVGAKPPRRAVLTHAHQV